MAVKKDPEAQVLQAYVDRKVTRERAAAALGCSERQFTRLMQDRGLERVESARRTRAEVTRTLREIKLEAAKQVVRGKITEKQAAARAGCSERTIYRYLAGARASIAKEQRKR